MLDYFLIVNDERIDNFGGLAWSDDIETYTTILNFTSQIEFNVGQHISLVNAGNILLTGIITDVDFDRDLIYSYTVYDFGFYLGKNEITQQFRGIEIETAIRRLFNSVDIPVGTINGVRGIIDKPYRKQTVQAVLKDLLELATGQTGVNYVVDCTQGVVNIGTYTPLAEPLGDLSPVISINSAENLANAKVKTSIQDMRNRILVYTGDDKNSRVVARAMDNNNINAFGLMQEIIEADNNAKNFNVIAQNRLQEANRITTTIDVNLLGDDRIRKGSLIAINDEVTNVNGIYVIRTAKHTVDNGIHTVDCTLELER